MLLLSSWVALAPTLLSLAGALASTHAPPSLGQAPFQEAVSAQQEQEPTFEERMAVYEGRRLRLEQAFDMAVEPFSPDAAEALAQEVQGDAEVPRWYAGEVQAILESYRLVDGLEDAARSQTLDALRVRPDPASPPQGIIDSFTGAIETLSKTLGPHHPVISQRYFFLSNITAQMGRWDDSLAFAAASTAAADGLGKERGAQAAHRRMWQGWILRRLGRVEEAEAALLQARETLDRLNVADLGVWVAPRAHVDNYLGTLYMDVGRFDEAESLLSDYVLRTEVAFGPTSSPHLGGLNNLAILFGRMELHERAIAVLSRCLQLAEAGLPPASPFLAQILLNLGMEEQQAGRLHDARIHSLRVIEIIGAQPLQRELGVHARLQLARLARLEGRDEDMRRWADEAMSDTAAVGSVVPEERALFQHILVWLMIRAADWDAAEAYLESLAAEGEDRFPYRTEFFRVQLDAREADDAEILRRYESVIRGLDGSETEGSAWSSAARSQYGAYLRRQGALAEAKKQFADAVDVYAESREQLVEGFARSAFHVSPQPYLALVHFELGEMDDAFRVLEAGRGRSLHDLIQLSGDHGRAVKRRELARAEHALAGYLSGAGAAAEPARANGALRETLEARVARLRQEMAEGDRASLAKASSREELQEALAPDEAYLGWALVDLFGEETLLGWTLGKEGPPKVTKIDDGPAVVERLARFTEQLAAEAQSAFEPDPVTAYPEALALGTALFGLVDDSPRHLLLVPGELEGLPLEALRVGDEWAMDRWTMSYAPSATLHALLRKRASLPGSEGSILAVGNPLLSAGGEGETVAVATRSGTHFADLPPIPESAAEAKAVAAMFPRSVVVTGKEAKEERLAALGQGYSVIHIASHALIGGSDPAETGLVLNQVGLPDAYALAVRGERPVDGFLSVPEIASEWSIDADLVTLSACRSALGPIVRGEGYVGLSSALFQAGAGAVQASLWEVQDEPTRLFMEAFYREWRRPTEDGASHRAKAKALRAARQHLRNLEKDGRHPYAHPAFWSAFVLIGNPD